MQKAVETAKICFSFSLIAGLMRKMQRREPLQRFLRVLFALMQTPQSSKCECETCEWKGVVICVNAPCETLIGP